MACPGFVWYANPATWNSAGAEVNVRQRRLGVYWQRPIWLEQQSSSSTYTTASTVTSRSSPISILPFSAGRRSCCWDEVVPARPPRSS